MKRTARFELREAIGAELASFRSFERQCAQSAYTDTGIAWEQMLQMRGLLRRALRALDQAHPPQDDCGEGAGRRVRMPRKVACRMQEAALEALEELRRSIAYDFAQEHTHGTGELTNPEGMEDELREVTDHVLRRNIEDDWGAMGRKEYWPGRLHFDMGRVEGIRVALSALRDRRVEGWRIAKVAAGLNHEPPGTSQPSVAGTASSAAASLGE
jgi:hypothetical protein